MKKVLLKIKHGLLIMYMVIDQTVRRFLQESGSQAAAAFSFYAFLSLVSLVIMAGAVLGTVLKSDPNLSKQIIDYISQNIPGFSDTIKTALDSSVKLRGVLGAAGFLGLLYSGTKVFDSFQVWLNRIWGLERPKYLKKKARSLVTIVFLIVVMSAGFTLHYFFKTGFLSFLSTALIYFVGMSFIYSYSIHTKLGLRKVWAGALMVAVLIFPAQALLTWYYSDVSDFTTIYGSFAGFLLAILGIYYIGYIIYLGASLNRILDFDVPET
ncbi:MAG: YihY/virulence factor BrkB family protein [Actinomycetota bacterium]|nr:YihY/virulence factor BrkB family protein [Actinomycetota bacterium]